MHTLLVAAGGAFGAVMRMLVVSASLRHFGAGFPYGTFIVNVAGSFLMGVLAALILERSVGEWKSAAPFLITGVMGGFTTFSAFSLDSLYLIERGRYLAGAGYMAGSVMFSVLALAAGMALMRHHGG
ncbi:MAG: fluoride efflux transporter CrcB [Alphaproteobacteria bacterium]|nr:MAG: fluoride efflux transporter CrcB [Alphaproteobacteria bacterium]